MNDPINLMACLAYARKRVRVVLRRRREQTGDKLLGGLFSCEIGGGLEFMKKIICGWRV